LAEDETEEGNSGTSGSTAVASWDVDSTQGQVTNTGDSTFSVPLASLFGAGGNGFDLEVVYSSAGVNHTFFSDNNEASPSEIGLGWSLNLPTITKNKEGFPFFHSPDEGASFNLNIPGVIGGEVIGACGYERDSDGWCLDPIVPSEKKSDFYLKEDDSIKIDVKYSTELGKDREIDAFVITDKKGVKYTFDQYDYAPIYNLEWDSNGENDLEKFAEERTSLIGQTCNEGIPCEEFFGGNGHFVSNVITCGDPDGLGTCVQRYDAFDSSELWQAPEGKIERFRWHITEIRHPTGQETKFFYEPVFNEINYYVVNDFSINGRCEQVWQSIPEYSGGVCTSWDSVYPCGENSWCGAKSFVDCDTDAAPLRESNFNSLKNEGAQPLSGGSSVDAFYYSRCIPDGQGVDYNVLNYDEGIRTYISDSAISKIIVSEEHNYEYDSGGFGYWGDNLGPIVNYVYNSGGDSNLLMLDFEYGVIDYFDPERESKDGEIKFIRSEAPLKTYNIQTPNMNSYVRLDKIHTRVLPAGGSIEYFKYDIFGERNYVFDDSQVLYQTEMVQGYISSGLEGADAKLVLEGVNFLNFEGTRQSPPYEFHYKTEHFVPAEGYLSQVKYPTGGMVDYDYEEKTYDFKDGGKKVFLEYSMGDPDYNSFGDSTPSTMKRVLGNWSDNEVTSAIYIDEGDLIDVPLENDTIVYSLDKFDFEEGVMGSFGLDEELNFLNLNRIGEDNQVAKEISDIVFMQNYVIGIGHTFGDTMIYTVTRESGRKMDYSVLPDNIADVSMSYKLDVFDNEYLYILEELWGDDSDTLNVVRLSDVTNMAFELAPSNIPVSGGASALDMNIYDDKLYVSTTDGFRVYSLVDPLNPLEIYSWSGSPNNIDGIDVNNRNIFLDMGASGIDVINRIDYQNIQTISRQVSSFCAMEDFLVLRNPSGVGDEVHVYDDYGNIVLEIGGTIEGVKLLNIGPILDCHKGTNTILSKAYDRGEGIQAIRLYSGEGGTKGYRVSNQVVDGGVGDDLISVSYSYGPGNLDTSYDDDVFEWYQRRSPDAIGGIFNSRYSKTVRSPNTIIYPKVEKTYNDGNYGKEITYFYNDVDDSLCEDCADLNNFDKHQRRAIKGKPYKTVYEDGGGNIIQETNTEFYIDIVEFSDITGNPIQNNFDFRTSFVAPLRVETVLDGVTSYIEYSYIPETNLVRKIIKENNDHDLVTYIKYAYEDDLLMPSAIHSGRNMYNYPLYQVNGDENSVFGLELADFSGIKSLSENTYSLVPFDGRIIIMPSGSKLWNDENKDESVTDNEMKIQSKNFLYNSYGNIISTEDAFGYQSKIYYGASGECINNVEPNGLMHAFPTCGEDNDGNKVRTYYDDKFNIMRITNINNEDTYNEFDEFDRLKNTTLPGEVEPSIFYDYWYSENGAGISSENPNYIYTKTFADLSAGKYLEAWQHADGVGKVYQTQAAKDELGNAIIQTNEFNSIGKVEIVYEPSEGEVLAGKMAGSGINFVKQLFVEKEEIYKGEIDKLKNKGKNPAYVKNFNRGGFPLRGSADYSQIYYTSDPLARERERYPVSAGLPITTTYYGDGVYRYRDVTDQNGVTWTSKFDKLGHLVETHDPLNGVTRYEYDILGNLLKVYDAEGRLAKSNSYNTMGQVEKSWDLDSYLIEYTYNLNGNVDEVITPNGDTIKNNYDSLNRVDSVDVFSRWGDCSTDERCWKTVLDYSYDSCANGIGKLCKVDDNIYGTSITYDYDQKGQIIQIEEIMDYGIFETIYDYDLTGNVISIINSVTGDITLYDYNMVGQLENVSFNGNKVEYSYYDDGLIDQINYPNGVSTNYIYDTRNFVEEIRIDNTVGNIFDEQYYYDNVGNLLRTEDWEPINNNPGTEGKCAEFNYDDLYRLTDVTDRGQGCDDSQEWTDYYNPNPDQGIGVNLDYTYDAVGNRLTRAVGGYITDPWDETYIYGYEGGQPSGASQNNKLAFTESDVVGDCNYHYDAAGNLRSKRCNDGQTKVDYIVDYKNMITDIIYYEWIDNDYLLTGESLSFEYDALGRRVKKLVITSDSELETIYSYGLGMNPLFEDTRELLDS